MSPEIKATIQPSAALRGKLYARLKFSAILNLPESDFAKLIEEIENSPLFQKLVYPPDAGPRAILRKPFPHSKLSQSFYEVREELTAGTQSVDVQNLILKHQKILSVVKKIGQKNFEHYFLYGDRAGSVESLAKSCGLTEEQVREIRSFVLEFSIYSELFQPSSLASLGQIHYTPIAKIEIDREGELTISYLSPHLAAGRYILNRERLESLKITMNGRERRTLSELIRKIEWVNLRRASLQKILAEIILRQEPYLRTGEMERLLPMPQRQVAQTIGVAPSTVSRAIYSKSAILPWGEEKTLKDFFVHKKKMVRERLSEIMSDSIRSRNGKLTDAKLRDLLMQRFKIKVSRRSVNLYRKEVTW